LDYDCVLHIVNFAILYFNFENNEHIKNPCANFQTKGRAPGTVSAFEFNHKIWALSCYLLTGIWYREQSSANSLVVDFTASGHELFSLFPQRFLFGGRPNSFRVAEGDVLQVLKAHYGII
jgi:hypothetical protein